MPELSVEARDDYMLQRYLVEMTTYTEGVLSSVERESDHDFTDADAEMKALEDFLGEESLESNAKPTPPASSVGTTVVGATVDSPAVEQPPNAPGTRSVPKLQLYRGNLVFDIPVPPAALNKVPRGEGDEFSYVRYTAVTCSPEFFQERRGYVLRVSLFSTPRQTDIFVSVFFGTEQVADLPGVLQWAWDTIDHLHRYPVARQPILDGSFVLRVCHVLAYHLVWRQLLDFFVWPDCKLSLRFWLLG